MSATDDRSGAGEMAEQPASELLGGDVREGYAEIGDVRLHYVEAGDGPLIVLLHGFPEFWYGWRLQIKPLAAAGFRVVAPDMRGYNLSSRPDDVAGAVRVKSGFSPIAGGWAAPPDWPYAAGTNDEAVPAPRYSSPRPPLRRALKRSRAARLGYRNRSRRES